MAINGGRPRSHSTITAPDTDFVLLQPSPVLHWMAVHDDPESSDDSSQESMTQLHRSNSQRSITSQRSIKSTYSHGNRTRRSANTNSRPNSLLISPPASPRPAYRSKSIDDYPVNNVTVEQKSTSIMPYMRHSTPMITDEIAISIPLSQSSPKKSNKFKDRLMGSNVPTCHSSMPNVDSDDESTPLVSELSTPSHTQSDSVFTFGASPVSNVSIRSLPQVSERYIDTDYSDAVSLVIHESAEARALERQDTEEWDSPETPV
ncbi:hypothetical protein PV325_013411 [Microctonus aethiopoides]|nr:hypothetical protein PV325_013411 [Microctonus aethiopoides]KAK0094163.1 hypothetical protein PV326_011662 [Microctonus aethiopoides]